MKPNFALSLSFDGIRLLHRAAGGWRVVGEVALDAADMAGELAVLRRTATALEPGGLRTKLLLPAEQIKYLTIDTAEQSDAARREAARDALDGATPYPVEDLAFDISAEGTKTHIAAVARETLAEAEAFAIEHRFHPTSFATIPAENPYLGEPYFGPTKASAQLLAPGEEVEPDGIAVVVIGDVVPPAEPAEVEAAAEPEDEPAAEAEADTASHETPIAEDLPPATEAAPAIPEPEAEDTQTQDEAPAPQTAAASKDSATPDTADAAPSSDPEPPETEATEQPPAGDTNENAADDASLVAAPSIPALPSLGAASRAVPEDASAPAIPAPVGFSSRRAASTPERIEPVVTAPSLPADAEPAIRANVPPAPVEFTTAQAAPVEPTPPAPRGGFLSRRRGKAAPPAPTTAPPPPAEAAPAAAASTASEAERMTIFGARQNIGGKPRFLGLILTAALLVFLAGVAAWASVFLDDGLNLSRLFGDRAPQEQQITEDENPAQIIEDPVLQAEPTSLPQVQPDPLPEVQTASLAPGLSAEDSAVLDALREPAPQQPIELSDQELEENYATSGIWPLAPQVPPEPAGLISIDDLYLTSIDPINTTTDAVALPPRSSFDTDQPLGKVAVPAAAGTRFALDDRGLVIPTVEGALSPDGYTVYLGRPDLIPPPTPVRFQAVPDRDPVRLALAAARPKLRPGDLAETNERANLDGLTRSELASFRPRFRPPSVQEQAEAAAAAAAAAAAPAVDTSDAVEAALATPDPFENATRLAIQASVRPDSRPRNFARIVQRAQRSTAPAAETRVASTRAVAPRVVTPKIPSKASVAKQATQRNAINLRKVNLIGVYGKPSSRRALVRLANGRYKKVVVGDRIDGGRVSAIGDSELRYTKSGRNVVLKMPRG